MDKKGQLADLPIKKKPYIMTRWSIPFAGFLLTLMGGASYAWSVFVDPMAEEFGWTKTEAFLPFTVYLVIFALGMVPAGKLQDKIGPRKISFVGAILFLIAYGLSALVEQFPYPWWLVLTYGIIGGTACSLAYACAVPPARKWFPDKPGLAISASLTGFGLSALFFAPLKAGYLIPTYGIVKTFLILGITASAVCLFAAWLTRNPPDRWVPSGWEHGKIASKAIMVRQESSPAEVIRSPIFWKMWLTFALVIAGGFVAIGFIHPYGVEILGLTSVEAAFALSVFAAFNGFGRPVAGFLGDKFGIVRVMIVTYFIQAITLIFFHIFAITLPTFYIASALLGWGFAVTLALFPALTSVNFGVKQLGVNYGMVFTAFGVGALSPTIGSWMLDIMRNYAPVFVSVGILAGVGFVLCIVLKEKHALS